MDLVLLGLRRHPYWPRVAACGMTWPSGSAPCTQGLARPRNKGRPKRSKRGRLQTGVFQRRPDPGRHECILGIRPTLCCARRFLAIPQLCPGAGRTLSFVRELAAGLRRLGKTDGVACTAQHMFQVHLLHRLQVKGGVGLCGVTVESMRRGASGSASPSALAARRLSLKTNLD